MAVRVLVARKSFEVFYSVVEFVTVDVMDHPSLGNLSVDILVNQSVDAVMNWTVSAYSSAVIPDTEISVLHISHC
jgi:hypothetical protein